MKLLKTLLPLFVILLIISCSDESQLNTNSDDLLNQDDNLSHLCGYDYYLLQNQDGIVKRQDTWDNTVLFDTCEARDLWVCADPCFLGTEWECAINAAIDAYNALPDNIGISMNLTFDCTTLPAGETANIQIDCTTAIRGNGQTFPRTANGMSVVELNMNAPTNWPCDDDNTATCCQLTRTVMHELGHSLGLGHSEPGNNPLPETHIPGTPTNDLNSVFISGGSRDFCENTCEFSAGDLKALGILYPSNDVTIQGPDFSCVGDELEICVTQADGIDLTNTITWQGNTEEFTDDCFPFSFTEPGVYTVTVESCIDNCDEIICTENEIEITVIENVFADDDKCYCVCDAIDTYDDSPYIEYIEIDCCDGRDCADIISDLHGDVIIDFDEDCVTRVNPCKGTPPNVSLTGPTEVCEEEGYVTICVSGYSGPTSWTITGSNVNDSENSPHSCLSFDVEPGTYYFTTRICEGDCCVTLTHKVTVVPGPCEDEEECFCVCEYRDEDGNYTTEELPIDCSDDCDEQYPVGDEYFNCRKMTR